MNLNRNLSLDIAKGISVILMTLTHLAFVKKHEVITEINLGYLVIFKMPLFIFISGYLFTDKKSYKTFLFQKADGLLKPLFSVFMFTCILYSAYLVTKDNVDFTGILDKNLLLLRKFYMPVWFIVSLFFSLSIFRTLVLIRKASQPDIFIFAVFVSFILLSIINFYDVEWYIFKFSTLIYFLIFLFAGYLVRQSDYLTILLKPRFFLFNCFIYIGYLLLREPLDIKLGLFTNQFSPFLPTLVFSLSGICMVFYISKAILKIDILSGILISCGQSSFFILVFHYLIGNYVVARLQLKYSGDHILFDALSFFATIFICVMLKKLAERVSFLRFFLLPIRKDN